MNAEEFEVRQQAYKDWLREQYQRDNLDRQEGRSPLPRSDQERLAIFYNLPKSERMRILNTRKNRPGDQRVPR
jgi:hypothetical protein